jgi:hypothetical protein
MKIQINNISGTNFATASNVYEVYEIDQNSDIFEDVIDGLVLEKYADPDVKEYIKELPSSKKRIATLSLIGDDNLLWSKINSILNEEKSGYQRLKSVYTLLKEYVKIADVERKKHGEILTPFKELAEPMVKLVEKYDPEFWKNKNHKVLDSSAGYGTFLILAAYKFMVGLKDEIPNEEERFKWIVENCLYYGELQAKSVFSWLVAIDPNNEYKTNIFWGDFLSEDFDRHMKDVWNVSSFSISIQNPPYNSSRKDNNQSSDIYNLFVDKCHRICNKVLMVTPSRWFVKSSLSNFRRRMINEYGLVCINHINDNKFFDGADVKGGISYFLLDKDFKGNATFNDDIIDLKKYDIIPNDVRKETFSLIDKVINYNNIQHRFNSQSHFSIKTNDIRFKDSGNIKCYVSKQKGNVKYLDNIDFTGTKVDKWKLLIPAASGKGGMKEEFYNRIEIAEPGEICSESFVFFDFNSKEELLVFKSYLKTSFFSYLVRLRKIKQHVTSDIFKWVPDIEIYKFIDSSIEDGKIEISNKEVTNNYLFDKYNLSFGEKSLFRKNYNIKITLDNKEVLEFDGYIPIDKIKILNEYFFYKIEISKSNNNTLIKNGVKTSISHNINKQILFKQDISEEEISKINEPFELYYLNRRNKINIEQQESFYQFLKGIVDNKNDVNVLKMSQESINEQLVIDKLEIYKGDELLRSESFNLKSGLISDEDNRKFLREIQINQIL